METLLLTAVGSASASALLERYHTLGYRVIGCDLYPRSWNASSCGMDEFFQVPLASDPEYLVLLRQAVLRWSVKWLIPLTDVEVDLLCGKKAEFRALGCTICTPEESCVRICRDKVAAAELLKDHKVCQTIPAWDPYRRNPEETEFPVLLKPRHGRSSQGLTIVHSLPELKAALSVRNDLIAQPYLPGRVCTVETARDCSGQTWALPRRELLRTGNGLGTTVQILPGHRLGEVCQKIAATIGLLGVVNMEFLEREDGDWFLEINPRFSGGVGFPILAGADFAQAELICHRGGTLPPMPEVKAVTAVRKTELVITSLSEDSPATGAGLP